MTKINDYHHMQDAYNYAYHHSDDPDTKSGCKILLRDDISYIFGSNKIPDKIIKEPYMILKPGKYLYIEHCERMAIHQAAYYGVELCNSTLYVNWEPCVDCSRAIINAGIKRIVIHKEGQETYERLAAINKGGDWHEIDTVEYIIFIH